MRRYLSAFCIAALFIAATTVIINQWRHSGALNEPFATCYVWPNQVNNDWIVFTAGSQYGARMYALDRDRPESVPYRLFDDKTATSMNPVISDSAPIVGLAFSRKIEGATHHYIQLRNIPTGSIVYEEEFYIPVRIVSIVDEILIYSYPLPNGPLANVAYDLQKKHVVDTPPLIETEDEMPLPDDVVNAVKTRVPFCIRWPGLE